MTIGIPMSCTISNVDSNSDFALVYVVTVALNEPGSVVVFVFISDPQHCVNRQGTTALGSIESDEPSLTAESTPSQIDISLVNNTESSIILGFSELTILQQQIKTQLLIYISVQKNLFQPIMMPMDSNFPSYNLIIII